MTAPKPHEVHKLVSDLLAREELAQALQVCARWMTALNDSFLQFNYLCLAVRLGQPELALDWLEDSLHTDHWFSAWFLRRSSHLQSLEAHPRFQKCLQILADREQEYWRQGTMKPITLAPPDGHKPHHLLVGLHGNGYNTRDAARQWSCAPQQGWLTTLPLAPHLVVGGQRGQHWWDDHDESIQTVLDHIQSLPSHDSAATDRVLWGGFSKGGEVAMVMALRGVLNQRAFLTVGAGGYLHLEPERWRPIIEAASPEVRGVMMYSPYDLDRIGKSLDVILPMLADHGIAYQFVEYEADGHVFPEDFARRFQEATAFLFGE